MVAGHRVGWLCAASLVALVSAFAAGCGPSIEPVFPIKGKLLVKGAPAAGARLILHPVGGSERLQKLRPHGECDANGEFTLGTHDEGDGVPLGTFKVTVVWPAPAPTGPPADPEMVAAGPDQLGGKYAHERPQESPLEVTIVAGQRELPPLDLK
jgi:hypothetical protein